MRRLSIFKDNSTDDEFYARHLPDQLYEYFIEINLLKNKNISFSTTNGNTINFSLVKSKIANQSPNSVTVTVSFANSVRSLYPVISEYIFIDKSSHKKNNNRLNQTPNSPLGDYKLDFTNLNVNNLIRTMQDQLAIKNPEPTPVTKSAKCRIC